VVVAGEVKQAVQDEDLDLGGERVAVVAGLEAGGVDADGEVAGYFAAGDFGGREGEDVRGLVLAAEVAVERADCGVGGEEDADYALEADGLLRFAEKGVEGARGGRAAVSLDFGEFGRVGAPGNGGSSVGVQIWVEEDHRA